MYIKSLINMSTVPIKCFNAGYNLQFVIDNGQSTQLMLGNE